ncbi:hypothetical protein [Flavobacterium sp. FPG59]|jgi:hypothetical protein|uniref:hypothetical protein n=1 Tax=Flavobacterium sp. FPG59 TaxID=1929267 RepID=UPI000A381F6D|nr:hypothetical protein [Flavobacterium sp. FPG59]OUD36885.1 hypothetical protein FPG59_04150 [Flavobacterium sp. FPG59]
MKLTKEQLLEINEINKVIIGFADYFADYEEELLFSEERIQEIVEEKEDIESIDISFPGEHDIASIETSQFLELGNEIKSIKVINKNYTKTNLRSYYIVAATDSEENHVLSEYSDIKTTALNGTRINILTESIIVGLAATKLGEYDRDYWGTFSQYISIEIIYDKVENVLTKEKEIDLLNSFIFEVADSTGIALNFSEIRNPIDDYYEYDDTEKLTQTLRELEPFNEGMKLFVSAVQIKDSELKFLNFYKVLEHFAPIAVNIEANELMRKKLDAPKSSFEDGDFIRSVFELANSMRDKSNDEDLIKASFISCIDFVGLFKKLPLSIKKKIKKHLNITEITYSLDKQNINTASNIAAKIIYKTRNKVVHAKSNFNLTGDEIDVEEINDLNEFMKEASSQAIRWYSRQPNHHKLEIIK